MAGIWSSDCKSHSKVEWKTELACWSSSPEFTRNLFYPLFAEAELLNEGDLVSYLASQRLISEIHRWLLHGEKKKRSKSAVFACLSLLECILVVLLKKTGMRPNAHAQAVSLPTLRSGYCLSFHAKLRPMESLFLFCHDALLQQAPRH